MRPPEMATLEKPPPRPLVFQASGGPDWGQLASSPVSLATSSRLGPRHWGHSGDASGAATASVTEVARMRMRTAAGRVRILNIPDLLFEPRQEAPPSYNGARGSRRPGEVNFS